MRVIFAGTPEFAAVALQSILEAGHAVPLVLTQPDRPAGRGMQLQASPVKQLALATGIEVFQPPSLRDAEAQAVLRSIEADVMVVAAYGLILPQAVLDIPPRGCINIHASLLPRWRGAAPIQRSILAGDSETAVCIMQMEAGLDTGPVLHSGTVPIAADDTASSLHDKLAGLGAQLIVDALSGAPRIAVPQPVAGVTYAAKIEKAEAAIGWSLPAAQLDRQVRAFNPFPGAFFNLGGGTTVKVWRALPGSGSGSVAAGTVLAADKRGIEVACGNGSSLILTELQKAGGKRLSAGQFLAGTPIELGSVLS